MITVNRAASRSEDSVVDDAIGKEILRVVQPAAVDAAVVASEAAPTSRMRS